MLEQAPGGIPLGLGLAVEDKPTDFSCKRQAHCVHVQCEYSTCTHRSHYNKHFNNNKMYIRVHTCVQMQWHVI